MLRKLVKGSIRNKLILFLLAATIVPLVTSIVVTYAYTRETVKRESVRENERLLAQGAINLQNYLNLITQSTQVVYTNSKLYRILDAGFLDFTDDKSEITRSIQEPYHKVEEVFQVHLYVASSGLSFVMVGDRAAVPGNPAVISDWIPQTFRSYEAYIQPTHTSVDYRMDQSSYFQPETVITIHRPIYRIPSQSFLGLLSIDLRLDGIRNIGNQLFDREKEEFAILDQSGAPIISSEPEAVSGRAKGDQGWIDRIRAYPGNLGSFDWKTSNFNGVVVFQRMRTPYADWTLVKRVPYSSLYQNARELARINSMIFSFVLILVILATVLISIRFTRPIRKLIDTMNEIQTGKLHVSIDVDSDDELGILARRFRGMMQTINNLILREYRLELANKTNELKALQAQINPHFLNNALQSIGTLALQHQETKIYSLIASLGKMMRYGMNTSEAIVPLRREIEYATAYFELQKQRFGDGLACRFDSDPQALDTEVPKMILQPIVENYFKHGYDPLEGPGDIHVSCQLQEQTLVIAVTDNGRGMPAEELALLTRQLNTPGIETNTGAEASIGLANVLSRLRLYFQSEARMEVEAAAPRGLRVTLWIPLIGREGTPQ